MVKGDYVGEGTGTLPVSAPGVVSTVVVTIASTTAASLVSIAPTNSVVDAQGEFGAYISNIDTNAVTLTCNRPHLQTAMTFQVVVWSG